MTKETWGLVERAFEEALALSGDDRQKFVDEFSAEHSEAAEQLVRLLEADAQDDSLISNPVRSSLQLLHASTEDPWLGRQIDAWKITRRIADGGMGSVFLAKRTDGQYDLEAALKVMGSQLVSAGAVARFRAERQILANLNHPGIARLIDGGSTEDGLPYLVMEYVDGVPIDRYCDENKLAIAARLRLFAKVCEAVDFAHRNLIIHRDLKPANILVDVTGNPRLLDFGIAKLLEQGALNQTMAITRESARVMTPEFASPEQVRGEPVAVATDVYSLGVLLYRLLCGRRPYHVRSDMPSELARAIVEDEPSRPSTALVTQDEAEVASETISASRHTTLHRLRNRLRGDLDNIALKALRKEPERRYASARAFADDIDRFLGHQPVAARPDSLAYRARKFVRRNRTGVAVAAAIVAVIAVSVYQVVEQRNRAELAAAQSQQVTSFLANLFASASPGNSAGETITAADLLEQGIADIDRLNDQPVVQGRLLHIMGDSYGWLGDHAAADKIFRRALVLLQEHAADDRGEIANLIRNTADNQRLLRNLDEALVLFNESLEMLQELHGENHGAVAYVHARIGDTLRSMGRLEEARESLERAVEIKEGLGELDDAGGIDILGNLSLVVDQLGDTERAIEINRDAVERSKTVIGPDHPNTMIRTGNLGLMLFKVGKFEEALALNTIAYRYGREIWSTDYQNQSWVAYNRGNVLCQLGRLEEAEAAFLGAVELRERQPGVTGFVTIMATRRLVNFYIDVARYDDAQATIDKAIAITEQVGRAPGRDWARMHVQKARISNLEGKYDEAVALITKARQFPEHLNAASQHTARRELAIAASHTGRADDASNELRILIDELSARYDGDALAMLPFLFAATRHHRRHGNDEESLAYAERVYALGEKINPSNAWLAVLTRAELGLSLHEAGDHVRARPLLERAEVGLLAVFGETDWRVRMVRAALSRSLTERDVSTRQRRCAPQPLKRAITKTPHPQVRNRDEHNPAQDTEYKRAPLPDPGMCIEAKAVEERDE